MDSTTEGNKPSIPLQRRAAGTHELSKPQNSVCVATSIINLEETVGTTRCVAGGVADAVDEVDVAVAESDVARPATGIGIAGQRVSAGEAVFRAAV